MATSTLAVVDPMGILNATSLSNLVDALAQNEVAAIAGDNIEAAAESDTAAQSITFSATAASEGDAVAAADDLALRTVESVKQVLGDQSDVYLDAADEAARVDGAIQSTGVTAADRVAALRSCVFTVSKAKVLTEDERNVPSETSGADASDMGESSGASEPDEDKPSGFSAVIKYAMVALVGSFFLALCVLALIDSARRPIKGEADVSAVTDLPILAESSDCLAGERLWTNIQFRAGEALDSICIIPVSGGASATLAAELARAANGVCVNLPARESFELGRGAQQRPSIISCDALRDDVSGARAARQADATVVVVRLWSDTESSLGDTLSELALANASIAGVVVVG
ncbi:hypothetical protein AALA69_05890 [Eggerthellaceae bacterium 24-137]